MISIKSVVFESRSSTRFSGHLDTTLSVYSLYQCAIAPLKIFSFRCAKRQRFLNCFALNMKPVRSFKASDGADPISRHNIAYFDGIVTSVGSARINDFKQERKVSTVIGSVLKCQHFAQERCSTFATSLSLVNLPI